MRIAIAPFAAGIGLWTAFATAAPAVAGATPSVSDHSEDGNCDDYGDDDYVPDVHSDSITLDEQQGYESDCKGQNPCECALPKDDSNSPSTSKLTPD